MIGTHPPVTEREIMSAMVTDKSLKGFPEDKTELQSNVQPYWRVRDMLSEYKGVVYMGDRVEPVYSTLSTLHTRVQHP